MVAPDQVFLEGMIFYGYHGVHAEERRLGQRFVVDLCVTCDLRAAGRSDRLDETVSYSDLYRIARGVVEGEPRDLIEAVAAAIASEVLARLPRVETVEATVRKPWAPIGGAAIEAAGVRIRRARDGGSEASSGSPG
jgi:dihydroneopterin aldolase